LHLSALFLWFLSDLYYCVRLSSWMKAEADLRESDRDDRRDHRPVTPTINKTCKLHGTGNHCCCRPGLLSSLFDKMGATLSDRPSRTGEGRRPSLCGSQPLTESLTRPNFLRAIRLPVTVSNQKLIKAWKGHLSKTTLSPFRTKRHFRQKCCNFIFFISL
jgi:hypothetical protein